MDEIPRLCRLCLSVGGTSIFENDKHSDIPLSVKIMVCLSLPVTASDSLPKLICASCVKMVNDLYAFRETCMTSYMKLLGLQQSTERSSSVLGGHLDIAPSGITKVSLSDYTKYNKDDASPPADVSYDLAEVHDTKNERDDDLNPEEKYHEQENLLDMELIEEDTIYDCSFINKTHIGECSPFGQGGSEGGDDEEDEEEEEMGEEYDDYTDSKEEKDSKYECHKKLDNETKIANLLTDLGLHKCFKCANCTKILPSLKALNKHLNLCQKIENEARETILDENCHPEITEHNEMLQEGTNIMSDQSEVARVEWEKRQTYPCPSCGKIFKVLAVLRNHIKVHTGERPFLCSLCSRSFRQLRSLKNHEMKHNGISTHPCKLCGKGFFRPSDLEKHIRSHTGERPFMCSICSKAFHQLSGLLVHERIHTGERPYACSICPMTFNQWSNKHRHEKTHAGGSKPFACSICHRKYANEKEMKLHQAGHGGGRPHTCHACKKSFRKPSQLKDHLRRFHTNERPHKCDFCPKRFCALYEVKQHLVVHTGERPYRCSLCSQAFSQKGNLRRHHFRYHKDIPYAQEEVVVKKDI